MKEYIREKLLETGACAVGFAVAGEIDSNIHESFIEWIGKGWHGEMQYLERHITLRQNTDNVLPGAATVISVAYDYTPDGWMSPLLPCISSYAYGEDYHKVLRKILKPVVKKFEDKFGGKWRICIDSAPVAERYWALKSGIGKRGLNGSVIVENCGALCYLVEILTSHKIIPDQASLTVCSSCGECMKVCPSGALKGDGTMDSRLCINYLTIEKGSDFSEKEKNLLSSGSGFLFGCDRCLRVCPHNKPPKPSHPFWNQPIENLHHLTAEKILSMDSCEFKKTFKDSPLLYAGYDRLRRNALAIKTKATENT